MKTKSPLGKICNSCWCVMVDALFPGLGRLSAILDLSPRSPAMHSKTCSGILASFAYQHVEIWTKLCARVIKCSQGDAVA